MKQNFRKLIEEKGFNVLTLAMKSGVDRKTIYSLGRGANINIGTIKKVAEALRENLLVVILICYDIPEGEKSLSLVQKRVNAIRGEADI